LRGKKVVALGDEAFGKGGKVGDDRSRIERLKGSSVRALVINDGVAVVDEECTGRRKIAPLHVREGVVEKFVGVRRSGKRRNLEDKGGTVGGALVWEGHPCRNVGSISGHDQILRRQHLSDGVHILQALTLTRKHAPKGQ
jgi:hypothetical protein